MNMNMYNKESELAIDLVKKAKIVLANYEKRGKITLKHEYAKDIIKVYQKILEINPIRKDVAVA